MKQSVIYLLQLFFISPLFALAPESSVLNFDPLLRERSDKAILVSWQSDPELAHKMGYAISALPKIGGAWWMFEEGLREQLRKRDVGVRFLVLPDDPVLFCSFKGKENWPEDTPVILYDTDQTQLEKATFFMEIERPELEHQILAMQEHRSQVERMGFDRVISASSLEMAQRYRAVYGGEDMAKDSGLESYRLGTIDAEGHFRERSTKGRLFRDLSFAGDQDHVWIGASPHPDDDVIGYYGLMRAAARKGDSFFSLTATSGANDRVNAQFVREHQEFYGEQLQPPLDWNEPKMSREQSGAIRKYESQQALKVAEEKTVPLFLSLPFYEEARDPNSQDFDLLWEAIQPLLKEGRHPVFVLPDPDDAHHTHRKVTALFEQVIQRLAKVMQKDIEVVYYRTPWTTHYQMFSLHLEGEIPPMIQHADASLRNLYAASERVGGNGSNGHAFLKSLPGPCKAIGYKVCLWSDVIQKAA